MLVSEIGQRYTKLSINIQILARLSPASDLVLLLNSKILLILAGLFITPHISVAQVDLQNILPTFEEESENIDELENIGSDYIKSKKKKQILSLIHI